MELVLIRHQLAHLTDLDLLHQLRVQTGSKNSVKTGVLNQRGMGSGDLAPAVLELPTLRLEHVLQRLIRVRGRIIDVCGP
jgi:hypothetical protein